MAVKISLDHLPAHKQEQLRAVAELIQQQAKVEMIVLFGSYARGTWQEDPVGGYFSDFDILVVVEKPSAVDNDKAWSAVEDRADRIVQPANVSLIVHDIQDVNRQLTKGYYFFNDIKREGIMLYDSQRFTLAEAKKLSAAERREYAQQCFDEWFESASRFYSTFQFNLSQGWTREAAFLLHQATERFFHTVLLVYTAYKPKTHNIELLEKRCTDLEPSLRGVFPRTSAEEKRLFKLLKAAYIDARYSMSYSVTREELETMAGWARDLQDRVRSACRRRIEQR